jgi:hypothetical protein
LLRRHCFAVIASPSLLRRHCFRINPLDCKRDFNRCHRVRL